MIVQESDLIGQLMGYPIEVVQKMIDYQIEQNNHANVNVFQISKTCGGTDGFNWGNTTEGQQFWYDVIRERNFGLFFNKYPKVIGEEYPKVMMVWNLNKQGAVPRVVQFHMKNKYYAWVDAINIEDAESQDIIHSWNYAEDPLTFNKNN